jgi:hypothetical protein
MGAAADAALSFLRDAALLGLFLAAADLTYERKHFAKDQRMSFQDIKDENKQTDGDPQMKGMIRERQMRMSRNRMMADIATADVVLVNPTHVAVALRYERAAGPRGWWPRAAAPSPPRSANGHRSTASRWCVTCPSPGRCTRPATSATRSPPTCTPPWRRCSPSCSRSRPAGSPRHARRSRVRPAGLGRLTAEPARG